MKLLSLSFFVFIISVMLFALLLSIVVFVDEHFASASSLHHEESSSKFQRLKESSKKFQHRPLFSTSSRRQQLREETNKRHLLHKQQQPKQKKQTVVNNRDNEEAFFTVDGGKATSKNKNKIVVGDGDPWSWSGSSDWSFSSQGSSSSSSSSSSFTGTPIPPGPPEPTFTTASPTTTNAPSTPSPASSSSSSSSSGNSGSSSSASSSSSGSIHPYQGHIFTIYNNCTSTIWVAILENTGHIRIRNGGFVMARAGPPEIIHIPEKWAGRIWARLDCHFNASGLCSPAFQPCCASGNCITNDDGAFGLHCAHSGTSPSSLVEFSLDNPSPFGPYDDYDVSLVDGWSVPLSIQPVKGSFNPKPDPGIATPWCEFSGCDASPDCPPTLAVNGTSLSCYSPCQAAVLAGTNSQYEIDKACCVCTQADPKCDCQSSTTWGNPEYGCCRNSFGCTPYHLPAYPSDEVCNPWATNGRGWNTDQLAYINSVRQACSKVYAWQFDDKAASFQCRKTNGFVDYDIVFVTRLREEAGGGGK